MIKQLYYLIISLFVLISCNKNIENNNFTSLSGDYLGQALPSDSAVIFAPEIVSTGLNDRDFTVYPDGSEIYFSRNMGNFKYATLFSVKQINGQWTNPQVVEFAKDSRYIFIEPCISPDGTKLFFASNMPTEGTEPGSMDIWFVERLGDSWGKPINMGAPINTKTDAYFPTITKTGTLYFTAEDSVSNQEYIYRSRLIDGIYQTPEMLPENVNMGKARFNATVSPNEDFIIVPAFGMPDSYGATDYYIVFRDSLDNWSQAMNMGEIVNSVNGQEWSASLSPDGKYLFFMSAKISDSVLAKDYTSDLFINIHNAPQNGSSDIYWVNADFINELRIKAVF